MPDREKFTDFSHQKDSHSSIAAAEFAETETPSLKPPPLQLKMDAGKSIKSNQNTASEVFTSSKTVQLKTWDKTANFQQSAQASASKLPLPTQAKMEQAFQADFSGVKIHQNSKQASQLGAKAFTQGNDIHFADGNYQPNSSSGQELIGHELSHVVQQRAGKVAANTSVGGVPVNDSPSLEAEADSAG